MRPDPIGEARRQIEICNACRYCEGYCAVFPAITVQKSFADGDIVQLANLCHNCRGCYYACQYVPPHEFALNLPAALAEARLESWERFAWPGGLARLFQRSGGAVALALGLGVALLFAAIRAFGTGEGEGFYALLGHSAMVAIFLPAFLLPLLALGVGLRRYWREVGGAPLRLADLRAALKNAASLRNLGGGQGQGCNFEAGDRFSDRRRRLHQAALYGFLLCFAATASATVMLYIFGLEAPYGFLTPPKLLGVPGGLLLAAGSGGLLWLKRKTPKELGAPSAWSAENAFSALLFFVAVSGLALYALGGTVAEAALLALHLGGVAALFLLTPYSKMAHGFYRLAALARDAQRVRAGAGDRPG